MATAVKKNRKIFVLDTNVLLHDYKCMHNFDEHDIVVPITVLGGAGSFQEGERHDQLSCPGVYQGA